MQSNETEKEEQLKALETKREIGLTYSSNGGREQESEKIDLNTPYETDNTERGENQEKWSDNLDALSDTSLHTKAPYRSESSGIEALMEQNREELHQKDR